MKTVTFCGHSKIYMPDRPVLTEKLYTLVESLIHEGATEFLLGGYGDFDSLCAWTVKELKELYPHITSVLVVPYMDRDFDDSLYDCSEYPPIENAPKRLAIIKRNEYMVQKADVVISYVQFNFGGAVKTLNYAKQKKKRIIEIDI